MSQLDSFTRYVDHNFLCRMFFEMPKLNMYKTLQFCLHEMKMNFQVLRWPPHSNQSIKENTGFYEFRTIKKSKWQT